jgi:hypothetical protein
MTFFQTAWRLLNMPCEGMTRVASESLDRDLSLLESVVLSSHLIYCTACRRYLRQLRFMRSEFRRLARLVDRAESLPGAGLSDEGDPQEQRPRSIQSRFRLVGSERDDTALADQAVDRGSFDRSRFVRLACQAPVGRFK